jgi:hypothetical protein
MSKGPYAYTLVKSNEMPFSPIGRSTGKWDWLRQKVLHELKPDGDVLKVTVPTHQEAKKLQASAQNCSSGRKRKRRTSILPPPLRVRTAVQRIPDSDQCHVYVAVITSKN